MRYGRTAGAILGALVTVGSLTPTSAQATVDPNNRVRIGMSAPQDQWDTRLSETGQVDARRIFSNLNGYINEIDLARSEIADGRMPVLSFKIPNNDWAGVAVGNYDNQLRALRDALAALPGPVFATLHHEPQGDGTPANYAAMQRHALPILGAPANVSAGVIVNGFWWSALNYGLTDAEIAQWLPTDVLAASEVVAADTYQGGTTADPGEDASVKITRMGQWATRVGVNHLGIGEYNGLSAATVRAAGDAILADSRFEFANIFNSNVNNRDGVSWLLTGDRLQAFKDTVAASPFHQTPILTPRPATNITTSSATFGCTVDVHGVATEIVVSSWRVGVANSTVQANPVTVSGLPQAVTASRTGLLSKTRYNYRCRALRGGTLIATSDGATFTTN